MLKFDFLIYLLPLIIFGASPSKAEIYLDGFGNYQHYSLLRENWAGTQSLCHEKICENRIIPSQSPAQISHFFGQKSLISEIEPAMMMVLLHDKFGNLSSFPTQIQFQWQSGKEMLEVQNHNGIISRLLPAQPEIGEFWAAAQSGELQTERQFYRVIPNQDVLNFPKNLAQKKLIDNFRQFTLSTPVNNSGEAVSFGSVGQLIGKNPKHGFYIQPITSYHTEINAQIPFHALDKNYEFSLQFGRNQSESFSLPHENLKLEWPLSLTIENFPKISAAKLTLNDLRTSQGFLIDDGEKFSAIIQNDKNAKYEIATHSLSGKIELLIPQSWAHGQIDITLSHEHGILQFLADLSDATNPQILKAVQP